MPFVVRFYAVLLLDTVISYYIIGVESIGEKGMTDAND